uniref:Uncharacterized protein n=1 Tax=Plectus sambesii TaxID=2011161 RepID=A0A914VNW0_9BILA
GKKERPNVLQPVKRRQELRPKVTTQWTVSDSSSDEDSLLCGASDKGTPPRRSSDKQKPSTRNGQ